MFGKEQVEEDGNMKNQTEQTLFTTMSKNGHAALREDRPVLIVSSTSWTADEDFSTMLDAITELDTRTSVRYEFIITGSGDLKSYYEAKIKQMNLKMCRIRTAWLSAENYPKLLASSNLGVCLHYSSSGVDLPMKVVDMFGSELPVCAINFAALPELVKDSENGLIFHSRAELCEQMHVSSSLRSCIITQTLFLKHLFAKFPSDTSKLDKFKQHLQNNFCKHKWDNEWNLKAMPVFNSSSQHEKQQ